MDGPSISAPLDQLASAFCEANAHIHFQPSDYCDDTTDESKSSSNSSDQQAKDTLLSIVSPHLCRNRCLRQRLIEESTDTSCRSNQGSGSLLARDHTKLLAETTCNFKASHLCHEQVNLCFGHEPEKQSPNVKTRLKWTADLHHKFVTCVNLLGGAESKHIVLSNANANAIQLEIQQNMQQALEEQGKQIELMIGQLKKQK